MITSGSFIKSALDSIEEREARLLVWGLTDSCISREELVELIDPILDDANAQGYSDFYETKQVIKHLQETGLIFEAKDAAYEGYRSRMAETVRLMFHLRQLFPKHRGRDGWQQARTLVSDFRFSRRRRKYPKRNINPTKVLDEISGKISKTTVEALKQTLLSRDSDFLLADFQVQATVRILSSLEEKRYSGTLVSAGTGSGKTLAFYIPALSRIATHLIHNQQEDNWVKCLALYPRTELLKDQFSEIYSEARRLDTLTSQKGTKIRIGAFFGATPKSAKSLLKFGHSGWEQKNNGFRCGFMACPTPDCAGDLIWPEADIRQGHEHLICNSCGTEINDDEVTLTRDTLQKYPPDILFTTTEMLNQRMSDSWSRGLFGLQPQASRPPEMMLLDEVHTYSGFHGAQVAYLLRRWTNLVRAPITFVGLSATLKEGAQFFARLTGQYESKVQEIAPRRKDMMSEGAEYLLALKGDPVSKTSLLSTTIQTIMLLSRMLDGPTLNLSGGIFGKKLFAFTDDIDVINRLYFGMLDAEGRKSSGFPDPVKHPNGGLAHLRALMPSKSRNQNGQNWAAPVVIGHDLSERKRIGRTSSQDPGVIASLDVIVATASLEVGFNDPTVGAVVQHKAPRSVASFLQRKGRAGRSRKMRPWTVLVLSDYGRDRQAYQSYDRLFDPELDVHAIPLASRYIQHIQGVYALIDYFGRSLSSNFNKGSIWKDLAVPIDREDTYQTKRQQTLHDRLSDIISNDYQSEKLGKYLEYSLRITEAEAQAVLWEHPRPLITTVIPTALRRLSTNWKRFGEDAKDFHIPNSPLPEFAPATLFSDLNLPEVRISLPPDWEDSQPREPEVMPIAKAIRTFAPGRVSRRFGIDHDRIRHWIAPSDVENLPSQDLNVDSFYCGDRLGSWQVIESGAATNIEILRPYEIKPTQPHRLIKDTSNAQLIWRSQFVRRTTPITLGSPNQTMWDDIIKGVDAYTHGQQIPLEIRRFAIGSEADIQREQKDSFRTQFNFVSEGSPIALGFSMTVDALRLRISVPDNLNIPSESDPPEKWQTLRTSRFHSLIWDGEELGMVPSPFQRQWLGNIYFSALTFEAFTNEVSLSTAADNLENKSASISLDETLSIMFQSPLIGEDEEGFESVIGRDQLREELQGFIGDKSVRASLHNAADVLWEPIDSSWHTWLLRSYKTTIAAATASAIGHLCPDLESDSLILDIDSGPLSPSDVEANANLSQEVWISETSPGGTGHIEEFIIRYSEDPRRFYSLLTAALTQSEHQIIDYQLFKLLRNLVGEQPNQNLSDSVQAFRDAKSSREAEGKLAGLRQTLRQEGFLLFHSFSTALNNRLIRAGTSIDTDQFFYRVLSFWHDEEERLGIELDPRTIAYFFSQDTDVDNFLQKTGFEIPENSRENWRFNVIYGMLWPRGADSRRQGLDIYNQFDELPDAEPLLVSSFLTNAARQVSVISDDWCSDAVDALSNSGMVTLTCDVSSQASLSKAVNYFATNPIPSEYLSVFARLEAIRRNGDLIEVDLELAEVAQ